MDERPFPDDPHSHARPNEIVVRHLSLDLAVDFDERRLTGAATLRLGRRTPSATQLVLDTWKLEVSAVTLPDGSAAEFELGGHDEVSGSALTIAAGDAEFVVVHYAAAHAEGALQWLEPAQTASGERFLFTQSQATWARSWVPVQDTPSVRFTYDATVRVPADLLALMSAENPTERSDDGVYRFTMPQPVPSYLLALAVGDLEFRELGPRSGVYAEPDVVDAAAWEFADTEDMMAAAERLYGPYRWGRYDLLVLPPSFPYGGMENPRLTFVTPTVIAGDRSLVTLVAHELAHSWSGNLVTNATWNDLWLNEGFTVYFENRIDEELYGAEYTAMLLKLGRQDLLTELPTLSPRDQWLEGDWAGRSPDEAGSSIPYDKGSLFLRLLEREAGRGRFDAFLKDYFDRYAFQSMDTASFLALLRTGLLEPCGLSDEELGIEDWVHGPGLPDNAPVFESDAFERVASRAADVASGSSARDVDTSAWSPHEWVHFLRALPRDLPQDTLDELDEAFGLSATGNGEILVTWLLLCVESGHVFRSPEVDEALAGFLLRQGRIKFLRPLFTALARTPVGLARAEEIYEAARAGYHPVATALLDRVLHRE